LAYCWLPQPHLLLVGERDVLHAVGNGRLLALGEEQQRDPDDHDGDQDRDQRPRDEDADHPFPCASHLMGLPFAGRSN
jgi:hypothetical protein